jgi:hypothetical protein
MESPAPEHRVTRLFPFVLKTRALLVEAAREQVLKDFIYYPVVQYFHSSELEKYFNVKGAKAVGFLKSGLAQSIYAELKEFRINQPIIRESDKSTPAPAKEEKAE